MTTIMGPEKVKADPLGAEEHPTETQQRRFAGTPFAPRDDKQRKVFGTAEAVPFKTGITSKVEAKPPCPSPRKCERRRGSPSREDWFQARSGHRAWLLEDHSAQLVQRIVVGRRDRSGVGFECPFFFPRQAYAHIVTGHREGESCLSVHFHILAVER